MNIEKFKNTLAMLSSPDDEDKITALTIFEQISFKEHMAFILLALKHSMGRTPLELWKEHCPKIMENVFALRSTLLDTPLTYKTVLKELTIHKADAAQMQFFLDEFSSHMLDQMRALGYTFIEEIKLEIKIKEDELTKSGELSESN